jgi:hypothetical protein
MPVRFTLRPADSVLDERPIFWQPSLLPGDPGGTAPLTQQTFCETGKAPRQAKPRADQPLLFSEGGPHVV